MPPILSAELEALWRPRLFEQRPPRGNFRYPPRRRRRIIPGEDLPLAEGELPPPPGPPPLPQATLWPFLCWQDAGSARTTVVSPRFAGPAFIKDAWLAYADTGAAPPPVYGISWSPGDLANENEVSGLAIPGNSLWEPISVAQNDVGAGTIVEGPFQANNTTIDTQSQIYPIGKYIDASSFVLAVSAIKTDAGVGATRIVGYVRIIENVDPRHVLQLLGR